MIGSIWVKSDWPNKFKGRDIKFDIEMSEESLADNNIVTAEIQQEEGEVLEIPSIHFEVGEVTFIDLIGNYSIETSDLDRVVKLSS